jgi:serine/threonine protein kinase
MGFKKPQQIGEGGFGLVFRATNTEGRVVALKVPFGETAQQKAFYEEIKVLRRIQEWQRNG